MKLVTFKTMDNTSHAGVVHGKRVLPLNYPTLLELLQDPEGLAKARQLLLSDEQGLALHEIKLLTPIPNPPTLRDFYAFEQHVAAARALRRCVRRTRLGLLRCVTSRTSRPRG